ncbi:MAG TPA: transporter substrate-binding domain-containing protein [Candidatus Acidoferrales bacterium]|jgi:polar amino acid transport system substrate-binding protein|nr:transporter substrate-binding domain-containing protein [Candidatus Acidoferrales bacterium]
MKLRLLFTVGVALTLATACTSSTITTAVTPTTPVGVACTSIVLTGHPSYPPVAWANGTTLEGGGIDVIRRVARDNGIGITVVNEGNWDDAQLAVRDGKADAIVGIYKTQERLAYFHYVSPALAPDPSSVLIRAGEAFDYKNWNSLIGKRGVVGAGESYGTKFDAFLAAKLTTYRVDTLNDIYRQLAAGKADYALSGYYAAVTSMPKTIAIAAPDFVTEGLYLAFQKGSVCSSKLSAAFGKDIARLSADGTIARIFARELKVYEASHPH